MDSKTYKRGEVERIKHQLGVWGAVAKVAIELGYEWNPPFPKDGEITDAEGKAVCAVLFDALSPEEACRRFLPVRTPITQESAQ